MKLVHNSLRFRQNVKLASARFNVDLSVVSFLVVLILSSPSAFAQQAGSVELDLKTKGADQVAAPVFAGIPFPAGRLFDSEQIKVFSDGVELSRQVQVLSKYRDGSLRVLLLGLRVTSQSGEKKRLTIAYNQGQGVQIDPPIDWQFNQSIILSLPSAWYSQSDVFGPLLPLAENTIFLDFDWRMIGMFKRTSKQPDANPDNRNFYDHAHALYGVFLRKGNASAYKLAHQEVLQYRENEIIHSGKFKGQYSAGSSRNNAQPIPISILRRMYIEGLIEHYYLTGDPRSFEVAREIADAFVDDVYRDQKRFVRTERNPSFPLIGLVVFYEATLEQKYLDAAKLIVDTVLDHQAQMAIKYPERAGAFVQDPWFDTAETTLVGASPWMTTLLCDGLIKYYRVTGDERVKQSVIMATDWLVNVAYVPVDKSYYYAEGDPRLGTTPDLNPMMLEMLGLAWQATGDSRYRDQALEILSVNAWGSRIKSFNQAMRSSGRGLKCLQEPPGTVRLKRADTN